MKTVEINKIQEKDQKEKQTLKKNAIFPDLKPSGGSGLVLDQLNLEVRDRESFLRRHVRLVKDTPDGISSRERILQEDFKTGGIFVLA